jgi:RNA polymerase sigma-70 factor (ECF subfamily)
MGGERAHVAKDRRAGTGPSPDQAGAEQAADARRVEAALSGDSAAYDALVERYAPRIFAHVRRMMRSAEDAEDLTQDTFIRAYRYLESFDPARSFRAWLYTIATRLALNALRSKRRRGAAVPLDAESPGAESLAAEAASVEPQGPEAVARLERQALLDKAVAQLPERHAALVHMHYAEDMPIREAAGVLGMTENAAKVALCRARKRLRELLADGERP